MKILIVDDNSDDRRLLRYIVEKKGHEAVEAEDGLDGLRMAKKYRPDLIISDALMPVMDGFQFLRSIKEDDALKTIPFIFYSAIYKAEKDVDLALALGAEAYIIKPKVPTELWEEVELIIQERSSEPIITPELIEEDEEYLKRYSQVVAAKLEEKVRELEDSLALRKKAEKEADFLASIVRHIPLAVCSIDPHGNIISWNQGAFEMLGYASSEAIGKHISMTIPEKLIDSEITHCIGILNSEGYFKDHESVRRAKDGRLVPVDITAVVIRDDTGSIVGYTSIMRDITEKKRLEEQLRQAQKMEAVGQLAGGIAHDFNNILSAIIGYGSLLEMKMQSADPLRANVVHILEAADRAATLTHSLLAFSRKQAIDPKPADMNDIIRRVEKFLVRIIGEDIEFKTVLSDEALSVNVDSSQIEQVLINLATNARDAMPGGGIFSVATTIADIDEDFIRVHGFGHVGRHILVCVSDSGVGMEKETIQKIFEPFFTTKEPGKGTGLGLSIVYGIIKQHNGFVNVYSEKGKGTCFKIYIPEIGCGSKMKEKDLPETAFKGGSETILLAEDDSIVRNLTNLILSESGYRVITAEDGQDAVAKFMENRDSINLLIFDIVMPKKGGREALVEIRAVCPGIKALFTSGYTADGRLKNEALDIGVDLLLKPVTPKDLLRKVREVLDG